MGNILDSFVNNDESIVCELDRAMLCKMDKSTLECFLNKNILFLKNAFEERYNDTMEIKMINNNHGSFDLCVQNLGLKHFLDFNYSDDFVKERQFGKGVLYYLVNDYFFDIEFAKKIYGSVCNIYYCRDEMLHKLSSKRERGM